MFGLKIWKIVSGVLSIVLSIFVCFQSMIAGLGNTLFSTGEISGSAGVFVSIMLLVGGIVSIVTSNGSNGGDIALAVLFFLGAVTGFVLAGSYGDLVIWAFWCLICMFVALFSLALRIMTRPSSPAKPRNTQAPKKEPALTMSAPLKQAIIEPNPKKRDAMVDDMSEEDAKTSLKYILQVIARKRK